MAIHTKLSPMYFKNISPAGMKYRMLLNEKKGRDLTQSYDKSPYTHKKSKNQLNGYKPNVSPVKSYPVLLCHILLSVRWLAIDLVLYDAGRTLYWCDSGTNRIEKVDLGTSERTVVLDGVNDCRDLVLVDDDIIFVDNTMT